MPDLTGTDVHELLGGALWTTPRAVDLDSLFRFDADGNEPEGEWLECFRDTANNQPARVFTVNTGRAVGVTIDEVYYDRDDWSEYAESFDTDDETDSDDAPEPMSPREWESMFETFEQDLQGGPSFGYAYPTDGLDFDPETANKIADLSLCLLSIDGDTYLALSGGGMNMSWEICAAFVALGLLPPVHFAKDLPAMGARPDNASQRVVVDACRQSLVEAVQRLSYDLELHDQRFPQR
jgi:hypothetical protein